MTAAATAKTVRMQKTLMPMSQTVSRLILWTRQPSDEAGGIGAARESVLRRYRGATGILLPVELCDSRHGHDAEGEPWRPEPEGTDGGPGIRPLPGLSAGATKDLRAVRSDG